MPASVHLVLVAVNCWHCLFMSDAEALCMAYACMHAVFMAGKWQSRMRSLRQFHVMGSGVKGVLYGQLVLLNTLNQLLPHQGLRVVDWDCPVLPAGAYAAGVWGYWWELGRWLHAFMYTMYWASAIVYGVAYCLRRLWGLVSDHTRDQVVFHVTACITPWCGPGRKPKFTRLEIRVRSKPQPYTSYPGRANPPGSAWLISLNVLSYSSCRICCQLFYRFARLTLPWSLWPK